MADKKEKQNESSYYSIINSPEWQRYVSAGRTANAPANYNAYWANQYAKEELERLRKEDKNISNYYEIATGQKATPEVIARFEQYASDPAMLQAAISKQATLAPATGKFAETIGKTIQEKLGRPATEAELSYYGKQMEQGAIDPFVLNQFLENTNEYQTRASETARGKLASELGSVDESYLAKVQKALESKYAAAGRPGSSAFGAALIRAGKDLATERAGYLAGLGYQDFQRGQGNLRSDYENRLQQMYGAQQAAAGLGSESRARYYSQQDFARQQAAQERLMRLQQPKSGSFLQNLVPGLISSGAQVFAAKMGQPQSTNYNMGGNTPYPNYVMRY